MAGKDAKPTRATVPFVASKMPPTWVLLNPLFWFLWVLDFFVSMVLPLPGVTLLKATAKMLTGTQSQIMDEAQTRRAKGTESLCTTPVSGCDTAYALMNNSFKQFADLKAMGTRKFLGWHTPEKAKFPLKIFGDSSWKTYADVGDEAHAFGRGLVSLGMQPISEEDSLACTNGFGQITGPHCLLIFEETSSDWMTAAIGAMSQSLPVATSYSTLGMSAVGEALNETNAPAILCNYKDVERVAKLAQSCCNLKYIIYSRNYTEDDKPEHPEKIGRIQVLSFQSCVELGNSSDVKDMPATPPTKDHLGLIMYTSGSTGKPKGVMLKQGGIAASIAAFHDYVGSFMGSTTSAGAQEVYLAYLPAAHILEFTVEMGILAYGAAIGYSDPKTISSKGAVRRMPDGSLNNKPTGFGKHPPGGIQEFAPTLMAAVPKIWDILKKGVEAEIAKASPVLQGVFLAAFAARSLALQQGRSSPVCDLIFKKPYQMLGGRLKLCVSGGGPLSPDIQNFVRVAFNVNLVQGYGLTETCAAGTVQPYWSVEDSVTGPPVKSVELRLNSCTEVLDRDGQPYLNSDREHLGKPCAGRGEVWIRGPPVSSGYYMMEEKTREEFDADGWFHTGDIAIWTSSGMLKIVDRLKNLVKLKGGEYIAIEAMEATYSQSVFVNGINGGLMCYGDGDMDRPVALVQVTDFELKKWADGAGVSYSTFEELCTNPQALDHVKADLNSIGKGRLGNNELLAAVALLPGSASPESNGLEAPWTPENQYLTASNKLNRKPILKGFDSIMKDLRLKGIK